MKKQYQLHELVTLANAVKRMMQMMYKFDITDTLHFDAKFSAGTSLISIEQDGWYSIER